MLRRSRNCILDVFDYSGHKVCTLYDNSANVSGQAVDVFVTTERNGWKELSFELPGVCDEDGKQVDNYRLKCLKADYKIRLIDDDGIDWFLISEPRITHQNRSNIVNVVAGHISQLLKLKNLGLEFSDKDGNNIGTAAQLLTTILEGTGWSVGTVTDFFEKDGTTIKVRSLSASAKTGAFKLITQMCDLFEAKPVFHGNEKTVDILPMNPFSVPVEGNVPDVTLANGVIELNFDTNVSKVSRTLNTEHIVTKLYAYGSYGNDIDGYCGIDEIKHREFVFTLTDDIDAGTYYFSYEADNGDTLIRNFTTNISLSSGDEIRYSMLDPASQMYVYVEHENVPHAFKINIGTSGTELPCSSATEELDNWFSFVMDFKYYLDIGLFDDNMLLALANYQQNAAKYYTEIFNRTTTMQDSLSVLRETIGSINFCRLAIAEKQSSSGYALLSIDKSVHPDGVIYRTDYDQTKENYFKWITTSEIKTNGDPVTTGASMVLIIHDTDPVTWDKAYIKEITDPDAPTAITLHKSYADLPFDADTDEVFLFQSNNINGWLGALEIADEAKVIALTNALKVVTAEHPVYFSTTEPDIDTDVLNGYGWWWKQYNDGTHSVLYFCDSGNGDEHWRHVFFQREEPESGNQYEYWYNWETSKLYQYDGGWEEKTLGVNNKVGVQFATVYQAGMTRDQYRNGVYENYTYTVSGAALSPNNYYMESDYETFWVFSTKEQLPIGATLTYNTEHTWTIQTVDGVDTTIESKNYRFDNVRYHPENCYNLLAENGVIDKSSEVSDPYCRTQGYIPVYPNNTYLFYGVSGTLNVYMYDYYKHLVSSETNVSGNGGTIDTPTGIYYLRVTCAVDADTFNSYSFIVRDYLYNSGAIVIDEQNYYPLTPRVASGDLRGIVPLMGKFKEYADEAYVDNYDALVEATSALREIENTFTETLGDLLREGYWQKNDYVDGDEQKLYDDAIENIEEISKPEASYGVSYIDLYGIENTEDFGCDKTSAETKWNDLSINTAVHLIDDSIDVNCWAFIDKLNKCYDQPWKTSIAINTNLSTIGQHSFSDVMTNIANVASDVKGKMTMYSRAGAITGSGSLATQRLEGVIDAQKLKFTGGASTWYTDEDGNMVFESADGISAMKITGNGFELAKSKDEWGDWNWTTFGTGEGFSADMITTGTLLADLIQANSITANKLSSDVGESLELSSNQSVQIIASEAESAINTASTANAAAAAAQAAARINGDSITQLNNNFNQAMLQLTPNAIVQTVTQSSAYQNDINSLNDKFDPLEQQQTLIQKWMVFSDNGLTIGSTGEETDRFSVNINQQQMSFYDGTTVVAFVSNNKLYINEAQLLEKLAIGKTNGTVYQFQSIGTGLVLKKAE